MRKIKFRAWNIQEEFMHEVVSVGCDKKDKWNTLAYMKNGFIDSIEEPHILMQYTGLNDKNGTEIYEGDVVLEDGNKIVVKYGEQEHEENYGDKIHYLGFNLTPAYGYPNAHQREIEVIGNIYENPELLEVSK